MRLVLYSCIVLLMGSCATMFSSKKRLITIYTPTEVRFVINKDTIPEPRKEVEITVERKKQPLFITIFNDSTSKTVRVNPHNSFMYYCNALPMYTFIYGFFIDRKKPRRYTYPHRVYINTKDTVSVYTTYDNSLKKGRYYFHLSIPYANHFFVEPIKEPTFAQGGFFGISGGLDYYYRNDRYVTISGTSITDSPFPFPIPFEYFGDYTIEATWSYFGSATNNHDLGKYRLGYGLSYAENYWLRHHHSTDSLVPSSFVRKINKTIGLTFNAYCKIGRWFNLGIIYRPSLYTISDSRGFVYEHSLSLDLAWKIHLHKKMFKETYHRRMTRPKKA